ncbi:MAG: hypothetical protein EYC62_02510 [Alphaproteobacteria bacterium]|nr:MAG: hypothetical protein EYC62_02510 [Alphaproteobacteria bacterium]
MFITQHRLSNPYCAVNCLANAANFDGTNDYLKVSTDLSANLDGPQGIISFWFRLNGIGAVDRDIYSTQNQHVRIYRTSAYKIRVQLQASNGTDQFIFETVANFGPAVTTDYTHIIASWDTNYSAGNKIGMIYVNDALSTTIVSDASGPFNIDYTDSFHSIGGANASHRFNGDLAGFYLSNSNFLDISLDNNRRAFITAGKKPTCDLRYSRNSGWASGSAPIIYLKNSVVDYGINDGFGGNFAVVGALSAVAGPCNQMVLDLPVSGEGQ